MKIKTFKINFFFYLCLVIMLILSILTYDLSFKTNLIKEFKKDTHHFLIDHFNLPEKISYNQIIPATKNFILKVFNQKSNYKFNDLFIDIKLNHLNKIKNERNTAIKKGFLEDSEYYPITIKYQNILYRASLRLKGNYKDHWSDKHRWSFRIKLKNGKTIFGFNRFSIQRPNARQFPHDHLFQSWMRKSGNLAPRNEYVRIHINGYSLGIMNIEEHMSKQFLELAKRKNSPIFSFKNENKTNYQMNNTGKIIPTYVDNPKEITIYSNKSERANPDIVRLISYGKYAYENFFKNKKLIDRFFDIESTSNALIGSIAWNRIHTLLNTNSRYYLNPYSLKFEQITTDQASILPTLENNNNINDLKLKSVNGHLLNHKLSDVQFPKTIKNLSNTSDEISSEYELLCKKFVVYCSNFDRSLFQKNFNALNIKLIKNILENKYRSNSLTQSKHDFNKIEFSNDIEFPVNVWAEHLTDGQILIYNLLNIPAEILKIEIKCQTKKNCEEYVINSTNLNIPSSNPKNKGNLSYIKLKGPTGVLAKNKYIKLLSRVKGFEKTHKSIIKYSIDTNIYNPLISPNIKQDGHSNSLLKKLGQIKNGFFVLNKGKVLVKSPIILPEGLSLKILPGTEILFSSDSFIIVNKGHIIADGKNKPISMKGISKNYWKGLYVIESNKKSILKNVTISDLNALRSGVLMLTGGINFYKSDVQLENIRLNNINAEDGLNIINSKFKINNIFVNKTNSDAIDIDYSEGVINNSNFTNIGGDALDFSGSKVSFNKINFNNIFDKAISVGEKSFAYGQNLKIKNSGVGIASKDGSIVKINSLKLSNIHLHAAMTYKKKQFYGNSRLEIFNTDVKLQSFFNQINNDLMINGIKIEGKKLNVKKLYSSGRMKKK